MNPRAAEPWSAAAAAVVAVTMAAGIAEEAYGPAIVAGLALVFAVVARVTAPRVEAWPLAAILAGYIIGNRSFAQVSLAGRLPLLPAEAVLVLCLVMLLYRSAKGQAEVFKRNQVNLAVSAWVILGMVRIWPDFQRHGFMAVRDLAVVYYALFFFAAQALASHEPSLRLLRRAILGSLLLLPVAFLLLSEQRSSDMLPDRLRIFYKDDLVAACLVAAVFLTFAGLEGRRWLQAGAAAGLQAALLTIQSSRAALVALAAGSLWWVAARRWEYVRMQAGLLALGVAASAAVTLFSGGPIRESVLAEVARRVVSIADPAGSKNYDRDEHGYLSDNNRFRMAWWRQVATEVAETSPLTGLGFGHDLSRGFQRTYEQDLGEQFSARSPHSIVFTSIGRMGLIGLAAWFFLIVAMARATLAAVREAREGGTEILGWWSAAWVLMVSACFGVVLEGPMGAVLFWCLLGVANQAGRPPRPAALPPA